MVDYRQVPLRKVVAIVYHIHARGLMYAEAVDEDGNAIAVRQPGGAWRDARRPFDGPITIGGAVIDKSLDMHTLALAAGIRPPRHIISWVSGK